MDIPFDELALPLTKEERDEYGKRVIKEYDKDLDDYLLNSELSMYNDSDDEYKKSLTPKAAIILILTWIIMT